jgi:PIN domain nuclease of toxin-antitoxin system
MKWLPRLIITILLSSGIAVALSLLPQLENGWDSPVFNSVKAQPVSETNIVDVMSKMQLHLRIRKVEVSHAIISIDLFASPSSDRQQIVQDLYEIPNALFGRSTNINQVLVRVLDGSQHTGGSASLMLAADARREKWLSESGLSIRSAEEKEQYLQSHFRVTYTPYWREKFDVKS